MYFKSLKKLYITTTNNFDWKMMLMKISYQLDYLQIKSLHTIDFNYLKYSLNNSSNIIKKVLLISIDDSKQVQSIITSNEWIIGIIEWNNFILNSTIYVKSIYSNVIDLEQIDIQKLMKLYYPTKIYCKNTKSIDLSSFTQLTKIKQFQNSIINYPNTINTLVGCISTNLTNLKKIKN
ncbi:hypothetical protein QTN25_010669 [Entamoeba marina]